MGRSKRRDKQITIEDVLGRAAKFRASMSSPASSQSLPVRTVDSDDEDDEDDDMPIQRSGRKRKAPAGASSSPVAGTLRRRAVLESDDDDEEDAKSDSTVDDILPRRSSKPIAVSSDDDDDEDEDEDDVRPVKRLRRGRQPSPDEDDDSDDSDDDDLVILTPPPKQTPSRLVRSTPQAASSASRSARKSGARSARQRHMELLRRRRMGEKVTESDLEDVLSEEEEPRVALYDKDPDHVALSDFEDDEEDPQEEEEEVEPVSAEQMAKDLKKKWKKDKKKERKEKKRKKAEREQEQRSAATQLRSNYDEESDDGYNRPGDDDVDDNDDENEEDAEDMAGFIDDSNLGILGAPDGSDAEDVQAMLRREIPLQFTFQAHKPLKSHFKDAIEWLVHRRVNPGGAFAESDDELYKVAWDRLDREVGGLAQSRFISSVWTPEFYGTLRARPYMDSFNIRPSGGKKDSIVIPGMDENVCHACGRTNHPASYRVMFSGKAYDSKTLDDIEEADSDEEEDGDDDDHVSIDMNGNSLPPTSKQWYVGVVCHSNAETAHDLLHWRRALKDWVEEKLKADHLLDGLEGRKKKMKTRKRRAFANKIVDDWEASGTINSLFRDFSKMLEGAQAKSTKTLSRFGR